MNVGDFLVDRLTKWGVRRIYGYPGDGINGIMGALERAKDRVEFVQVRHEEMSAFMACAHAKWTGEAGVCLATSGPGAIHLLNGLYDAKLDHQPVVAIVGQQARAALAAIISRRSTSSRCSRTSRTSTCTWSATRRRCGTWSTARFGSHSPSGR
jgi:thiamine pyrophosphate-dependent acetolactate synthase large subunit-like protein